MARASSQDKPAGSEAGSPKSEPGKSFKRIAGVLSLESIHKELASDLELRKAFLPNAKEAQKAEAIRPGKPAYSNIE